MEIKPKTSNVLMSDVLQGQIADFDGEQFIDASSKQHVLVVAEKVIGPTRSGLVGILRGIHFDVEPEIGIRLALTEALDIVEASGLWFQKIELHHGERVVPIGGPYIVKAARIEEISPADQLCTLSLHLKKQAR